jgi:hypothetical protein
MYFYALMMLVSAQRKVKQSVNFISLGYTEIEPDTVLKKFSKSRSEGSTLLFSKAVTQEAAF